MIFREFKFLCILVQWTIQDTSISLVLDLPDGFLTTSVISQILLHLDLNGSYYELRVEDISWLAGPSLLEHLDMSDVDLIKASDWLPVINSLPFLKVLKLFSCKLHHFAPLASANFSSLNAVDLSGNIFGKTSIPSWVFGLSHLVFLDVSSKI